MIRKFGLVIILLNSFYCFLNFCNAQSLDLYSNSELFRQNYLQTDYTRQVSLNYFNPNYGYISTLATFNQYNLPLSFEFGYKKLGWQDFGWEKMSFDYSKINFEKLIDRNDFARGIVVDLYNVPTELSGKYSTNIFAYVSPRESIGYAFSDKIKPAFWGYDFANKTYQGFTLPTGSSLWQANFTSPLGGKVEIFASVSQNLYNLGQQIDLKKLVELPNMKNLSSSVSSPKSEYQPIHIAGSDTFFPRLVQLFPQQVQQSNIGKFVNSLNTDSFNALYQPGLTLHERGNLVENAVSKLNYTTAPNFYVREYSLQKGTLEGFERKKGQESKNVSETTSRFMPQPGDLPYKPEELKGNVLAYKQYISPQGQVYSVVTAKEKDKVTTAVVDSEKGWTKESVGYKPEQSQVASISQQAKFLEKNYAEIQKMENERVLMQKEIDKKVQSAVPYLDSYTIGKSVASVNSLGTQPLPDTTLQKVKFAGLEERTNRLDLETQKAQLLLAKSLVYDDKSIKKLGLGDYISIKVTPDDMIKFSQFYLSKAETAYRKDYLAYGLANLQLATRYIPFLGHLDNMAMIQAEKIAVEKFSNTPIERSLLGTKSLSERLSSGYISQAIDSAMYLPTYAIEYQVSLGIAGKILGSGFILSEELQGAKLLNALLTRHSITSTVMLGANPFFTAENMLQASIPDYYWAYEGKLSITRRPSTVEILGKGFINAWAEMWTEQAGGLLGDFGITPIGKPFKLAFLHSLPSEVFEEQVNTAINFVTDLVFSGPKERWLSNFIEQEKQTTIISALSFLPYQGFSSISSIGRNKSETPISQVTLDKQSKFDIKQPPQSGLGYTAQEASRVMDVLQILERRGVEGVRLTPLGETNILPGKPIIDVKADVNQVRQALENYPRTQRLVTKFLSDYQQHDVLLFSQGKFWQFNQPNLLQALPHEVLEFNFYDAVQNRKLAHWLANESVKFLSPVLPSFVSSYENNIPQFKPEFSKLVSDTVSKFMVAYQGDYARLSPTVENPNIQFGPAVTFARGMNRQQSEVDKLMSRLSTGDEIAFIMPADKVGEFRNEISKFPVHIVVGYYDVKHPIFPWVKTKYAQVLVDLKGMGEINKALGEAGGNEYIRRVVDIAEKYGGDTVLVGIQSIKGYITPQILRGLEQAKKGSDFADVGDLNLSGRRARFYEQWYLGNRLPNRLQTVKYFDTKGTMSRSVFVNFLEGKRSLDEINANRFLVRKVDSIGVVDKNSGRQVYIEFEYYDSKGNKIDRPVKLLNEYGYNIGNTHLGDIIINHAINIVRENQKKAFLGGVNIEQMEKELARRIQNEFKKNNINTKDLGFDIAKVKIKMVAVDSIEQGRIFLRYYDDFIEKAPYGYSKFSVDENELEKIVKKHINDIDNLIAKFQENGYDTSFLEEQKKKHLESLTVGSVAGVWKAAYEPIYGQTFDQAYTQHQRRLSSRRGVSSQSQSQFKNLLAFNELKELLDVAQSGSGEGGLISPAQIYTLKNKISTYNIFISKKGQPIINSIQDAVELWLNNARNCPHSLFVSGTNKINSAIADYLPDKVTDDIISYFTNEINKEAKNYENLLTVNDLKLYNIFGADYIASVIDSQAKTEADRLYDGTQVSYLNKRVIPSVVKVFKGLGLQKLFRDLGNKAVIENYIETGYSKYVRELFERHRNFIQFLIHINQIDVAKRFLFDLFDNVLNEYELAKSAVDKSDIAKLRKMLSKDYKDLSKAEEATKKHEEEIRSGSGSTSAKGYVLSEANRREAQERIRAVRNMYDAALCGRSLSPKVLATLPEGVDMYKEFLDWNLRETFGQTFSQDTGATAEGVRRFREAGYGVGNRLPASGVQKVLSNGESVGSRFFETDISREDVERSGETVDSRSDKGRGTLVQDIYSKNTLLSRKVSGDTVREIYRELRGKGLELEHSAKTSLLSSIIAKPLLSSLPQRYLFLAEDLFIASLLHDYDFTSQRGEKGPPRVNGVPLGMSEFFDKFGITPLEQQIIAAFIYRTDALVDDEARRNYMMLFNDIKQADNELAEWVDRFAEIVDYASRNVNFYFAHSVNDIVNSVEQMSVELGVDKADLLANLPVFLEDNAINHRLYNNLKGTILAKNLEHNFRDLQEYVKNLEVSPAENKEVKSELAQTFIQKRNKLTPDIDLIKLYADDVVNRIFTGKQNIKNLLDDYEETVRRISEELRNETIKAFQKLKETAQTKGRRGVSVPSVSDADVRQVVERTGQNETLRGLGDKEDVKISDAVRSGEVKDDVSVGGRGESVADVSQDVTSFARHRSYRRIQRSVRLPAGSLFEDLAIFVRAIKDLDTIYQKSGWAKNRVKLEGVEEKFEQVNKVIQKGDYLLFNALADYINAYAGVTYNYPVDRFNKSLTIEKLRELYVRSGRDIVRLYNAVETMLSAPEILRDLYNKELAQTYIEEKEKTVSVVPVEGSYVVIDNLKVNLQEILRGDWKEDFAKDDVKKVLSGIYHAVGNLRNINLKIDVPLDVYPDVHGWLGFDFSKLTADSQADPDLVLLSYGIQNLAKTNNVDIKVIPQVSIEDLTELPQVVSSVETKQEVVKSEQQQESQEVRAPPVEVKEQAEVVSSPKQTFQPLEIPDDRILTLQEAKEIIRSHSDLNSALVDIRPISPYHQKILLREPSGDVITYDMYCGKYGLSIYYKGQNVLKTNLGYVYGDKLKELFRPQLELREKNLEAVKQQTLRTQTQETQQVQPQQVTEQEVIGGQKEQPELRPYPVVRVAAKFSKDYNTVRNADVIVARDNFENRILDLYHRFGQGKYTLTDSVVGAYAEFYKQMPYYYDGDVKIDLPEPPRFNTEWESFYTNLINSFALFPEELCDKFVSWYGAYLTGETGQYGVKNAVELTQYITPLEKVTIDDLLPHLSKNLNPLNVKLPRDNTADRLRNIYEWLTRSGYEVGVFAMFNREYGEIQGVKFVRFVVLPKGQAGDINRYAEFSAKNLSALKIPYFDIPLGSNVLETETQAKYPAGYVAIKQKGNNYKLMSLREYLLSFVEGKVAEIINKQNVDLKEWAKDVRKNINYRLQQATVYKDPVEAYKNTVVPWNMYRVVVLDENGVPISEYSNRYIDLVKLYTACYYSLREQGYDVEVYKPDNGVLTLVPNSSLVFADPGKKHNFSRLNNIASSVRTQPLFVLPVSQVSNDFGSNVFFVVSDKYDDSLNILCDGGAWLNQNSALGKAEFYVPVKYTIELTPGVNQIIPNKIFEFISLKKELEHATGQRRDEILTQLKNFAIESKSGRIIIGDKVVNANKLYITDVSVIGGEGFGVNLIISGNLALPSNEVSFNLGYGGAKYVPEVVTLGRSDIDLVCSLKQGDERWVEIVLNAAFTRLKEMSRKEAPLTAAQRQQLEQTLAKVKSAGIEVFQTDDGVIYQFRANNLDNNKVDAYRKIIESTDKLAKEVFGEGLLRTIKIRRNGHEYVFKGYYVLGYPTTVSAVYRYPISNGRLDAKFFEYISAKYGADVSVEMMKYLDSANKTTALSCYQALYSAFVDENVGNNFEEYKVEEEYLQQALKDNKIAQEIIRELLYTTPKKVALPEGIYLAGKEQKYVFFPSLNRRFIDKPYKFFNDLEKAALTVLLSPTQENVENYYRVLEEKTFTKDGLLSEIFEVHNDAVLNFGLVVPRAGQGYTTVEISREALMKFSGGEKLLNKLAKGEKVYAVVLRHPLISPDTLAVVELKLSNDNTPLKIHPVLWSVLKGDFDKDSAVLVASDDMQKLLSSMYRQQQTLATAKLDKQIEEKRASLAEDYTHKDTFGEALEKVKKTKRDAAYDVAGVIGGSLRILTGNIHWSMYELREFVRSLYETCDLTPQDYLKYAEILWKIEQQPISGKKIADLFTNTEAGILNNPDVPIDTKLKTIESAFARNGLDVVIDLSRWNRARTVSPVRLGHLLKWQDFVSKSARLTSQDIDEFIMLTNLYFGQRKMGLSRYREGLVTEMTRAELLGDVPVGWHLVNTLSNRHPYSYWERIACEKLGIEFTPLPSEAVIFSGQSGEKVQGEGINRSAIEQTVGQAEVRVRVNNITSENPSIDLSNATGKEDVITQPAQQKTETRVEEAVGSPAEATFVAEKPAVESLQQQPSSTRGVFVHKGFPGNFNRGVVIVGDIHEARKYKEFVYTPKEIKNIVNEFNKKGVINGDKVRYVVDKLAYFDSNTGRYSKIPTQIDYSQFVICVSNLDDALKLVRDYKIPVLAIDSSYVKFNKRGFLKAMQNCIDAGVRDVYVYSPRVTGEDVVGSIVATLMGRVDLAVREFKSPWVKVPYSGYITSERIQQELTELNKKTLRNRIVAGITAGAITVGSYLGIDYFKKYQDIAAKTPPKVEVWVDQSAAKVEEKIENLARRGWETLRAEGRLPVNIAYDNLVGVKLAAYRSYFEKGLKQHLDVQNKITLRDLEGLSFDEVKAISLKAAKEVFEATGKVIVASEETEKSVPQAQQTQQAQQTAQQETQKTVVTLPVVKQTNPPVIDGITIRSIAVKRGGPTAVFVNFNNGVFIKCRAVQEGDKIRLIPMGLQANSKFMDFVTAWYTDWLKNSYDPQRGNGGYEEFTVESIDLTPEVDVVRQRNGKYIVSVFFGDALWFEKEIDVGPRGSIYGLDDLPGILRDEVRKQIREFLNSSEPPAGPPIGRGLSMNLFKQLVDKANQGDEHARRVLELYKKDFPELYYKQAQRSRMYEPKYGNKDKIVYIIVSNRPQVGKSMVGNIIAGKVGGRYIATSDVLVEILAQKLGIKPEYIKRARAKNPEAYRKELIQLGDNLTRKRLNWKGEVEEIPTTPGEEALRKALDEGANIVVIDGIRRRSELRKVVLNIPYGYKCVKIGVFGYSESIDNTESGLLYDCDYVIFSRGIQDKKEVVQEIDNILSDVKEIPQHWVQKYKNTKEFVVVDLETTGLSRDSQIIQIAVLKCKKQGRDVSVTDKYVTRVRLVNTNLDRDTVEEVKRITGIDLTETANEGKDIKHVLVEIEKYLLNYPVVMHNAAFDLEVLNYWRQKYGMLPFTPKVLFDTKALAKFLYPASETHLETLAREYGVEYTKPHDAENDALVTAKVFNKLFVSNPRTSSAGSSLSNLSNQKKRIITNIY